MKSKSLTPRKKTAAQLKKELDRLWSLLIRSKWAYNGRLVCYTCGRPLSFKEAQCGHFIPRNILILRWHPDNCRPQCVGCNVFGNGKVFDFEEHLVKDLGREYVEKMKATRHKVFKVDTTWYLEKIAEVKKELESYPQLDRLI